MTKRRNARMMAVTALVLLAVGVGFAPLPASAEPEPVYNEPADSGGEIQYVTTRLSTPVTLDPYGTGHWQDSWAGVVQVPDIDIPGVPYWALKSATFELVDENGDPMPRSASRDGGGHGTGIHLHHIVIATVGPPDPACPDRTQQGYKVYPHIASGAERTPISLADPYAQKVWDSEIWGATWHFMNMSDVEQTFYVEYTIGYDPLATNDNTRWAIPWLLDVTSNEVPDPDDCGTAAFDTPGGGGPGSVYDKSRTWTMPYDGVIVGTGGHLHDGGIATELRGDAGELICRSDAEYMDGHPPGHGMPLEKIDPCPMHYAIDEGDELTLHALYDNNVAYDDVMGINLTYIWPGEQGAGLPAFPDVPADHPFREHVAWGVDEAITTGYPDGGFHPGSDVTRQAYVAFLFRMAGSPPDPVPDPGFSDVTSAHPFYDEIAWAVDAGLVDGFPDGTFRPGNVVTRQAAVALLYRMAGAPAGPFDDPGFSDVTPAHPFYDEIAWAVEEGIVEGYPDGTFRSGAPVTRQAAMAFLFRAAAWQRMADLQAAWDTMVLP